MIIIINMATSNEMLEQELKSDGIFLVSFEGEKYREGVKGILDVATKRFKKICYVTVNDPCETIAGSVGDGKCPNIFFIDCVTSTVKSPKPQDNAVFVSSPHALTEISLALKKYSQNTDLVIFDSISSMLIYESPSTVLKFIHNLVLIFRTLRKGVIFIMVKEDASNELVKDFTMFVDKILNL